jgi:hypothetical protein
MHFNWARHCAWITHPDRESETTKVVQSDPQTQALLEEFAVIYRRLEDLQFSVDFLRGYGFKLGDRPLIPTGRIELPLAEACLSAVAVFGARPSQICIPNVLARSVVYYNICCCSAGKGCYSSGSRTE